MARGDKKRLKRIQTTAFSKLGLPTLENELYKAIEGLQEEARKYDMELQRRKELKEWLQGLPSGVILKLDMGNGDQELNEWTLVAINDNEVISQFSIGRLLYIFRRR